MSSLRRSLAAALLCAVFASEPASAALWPDVPDRVREGLASKDVVRRRAAAADVANLPRVDAIPLTKQALADSDVEVRLAAATAAARLGLKDAGEAILPWLTDADARLREGACDFFTKLPDPRVVKVLSRSLGDTEPKVRLAAVHALGASASPDAVAPLLARLDDSSSKVRLAVARALGKLGDKRAVTPLVSKVQDEASEVRQAVVRTLGDLGDPKASPALVIALRDPALEVRIEALSSLARLKATDAVASIAPLTVDASKKLGSADVRRAALAALGRIGTPAAADAIVRAFGQFEDEKAGTGPSPAREAAVSVGPAIAPTLVAILDGTGSAAANVSPAANASAAWALGQLRPEGAGAVLERAIRRGTVPLALGLHALASAGDPAQLPICLEHVASTDRAVRAEALLATARLLDPDKPDGRAVEPLLSSLDLAQTPEDRAEIAALLGRTGAARVAPVLVGLTAAKDEKLRLVAIEALGTLGVPTAGPALVKLLDDPLATVRLRAAISLARAGGADVVAPVVAKLTSASADRLAVVLSLVGLFEHHADPVSIATAKEAAAGLGNERELLLVAIGRGKGGASALASLLPGADEATRRAIAVGLGARADALGLEKLRVLAADGEATVRAQAAWSIGAIGGAADLPLAIKLVSDSSPTVAADAVAAVGRIVARTGDPIPPVLCAALDSDRPYVRANALAALRPLLAAGRAGACDDAKPRKLLAEDPNDVVRVAAARALAAMTVKAVPEVAARARAALEGCTISDPSGAVASVCREGLERAPAPAAGELALVVFVAPDDGGPPAARAPYAVERPDGLLHLGSADARGAVVELFLGRGSVRLRNS